MYAENADPTPELKAKVITGGGLVVADIDCIKGFIYVFCQTGILTLSLIRSRFFIGKGCLPPLRDELRQGQVVIDRLHRDEQNVSSTETCDSGADHVDPQDLKSFSVSRVLGTRGAELTTSGIHDEPSLHSQTVQRSQGESHGDGW